MTVFVNGSSSVLQLSTIADLLLRLGSISWGSAHEVSRPGVPADYPGTVKLARHILMARLDFQSLPEVVDELET